MQGRSIEVTRDKPVLLGTLFSKQDAYGFGSINTLSTPGASVKMVTGMTILRVQSRLLYAFVFANYKDEDSVQWVRKTSEDWVDAILKSNP